MKLDAHVIVGAQNETLLVRGAQYPLSRLVKDYRAMGKEFEHGRRASSDYSA